MDNVLSVFRLKVLFGSVLVFLVTEFCFADEVRIVEIAIAAPDILSVEIRDPQFEPGKIVPLDSTIAEPVGTWVYHAGVWGMVVGPDRRNLRLADNPPRHLLDRAAVDRPEGYRLNGQPGIAAVYRKSLPYDSGFFRSPSGQSQTGAAMKHQIFLKLDSALEPGNHTIRWPDGLFPETSFNYDPSVTRAVGIRATQAGHAPKDVSKKGYLALWVPGEANAREIDFGSYGLNRFSLLNDEGAVVFASDIKLKSSSESEEPWSGLKSPLIDYAAVGTAEYPITAINLSGSASITVPGHDFQTGDRIVLQRLSGERDASAVFATVGAVALETVEILDSRPTLPAIVEPGAYAGSAFRANRAGTYVFEMDYSAWSPKEEGTYRLRVDGLGVSDPFTVNKEHWKNLGDIAVGGLYNHRSGIPLDGRYGFERPAAFVPGNNLEIIKSKLPLSFTDQGLLDIVPVKDAVEVIWDSGEKAPNDYWGGYMDAGDWDRHIHHLRVSRLFLDMIDYLPEDSTNISLGIPKSSEVLDPELYAGTELLPDLLHEAIWTIDFYRRLQGTDGTVSGGIESAGHPLLGTPSFLESLPVFSYAPDINSTFNYAAAAGSLARHLENHGQRGLAAVYLESAQKAWDAAETGLSDIETFYHDALEALFASSEFDVEDWPQTKANLEKDASIYRTVAASALFRVTGEAGFRQAAEAGLRGEWNLFREKSDAAWDYINSPMTDSAIRQSLEALFRSEIALLLEVQETSTYPNMKHPYAPAGWGQSGPPEASMAQLAMRAHNLTGNDEILALVLDTLNGLLGANQSGMSLMTGVGVRQIRHPLHEDHRAMGVKVPPGIMIYGWAPANDAAYGWLFGPSWSPMAEVGLPSRSMNTKIEPSRFALPYFENLIEYPDLVIQQEYTVHQTIGPFAALAFYLDAQTNAE
ncbi:glycoside hydrolase family 9 protein [Roseibium sp.]|uniref:glycoside hydrolase family 9 protein n=1 Tax=Roseibium sp. TaxID=1936156 RepID=UPI003B5073C6